MEEVLGTSNGSANQVYSITRTPYIQGSLVIVALNPVTGVSNEYVECESLFDMTDYDSVFTLDFEADGVGVITMGDGINGEIPPEGYSLVAKYRIGGGTKGNVRAGIVNILLNAVNGRVQDVRNIDDAIGGFDAETVEEIQRNAPYILKTSDRLVNDEDFVLYVKSQYRGVGDAVIKKDYNFIDVFDLYIANSDRDIGVLNSTFKTLLSAAIDSRCLMGMDIVIKDPIYVPIKMGLYIVCNPMYVSSDLENGIRYELDALVKSKWFKDELTIGDIYNTVKSIEGVSKVNLTTLCKKSDGVDSLGDISTLFNEIVKFEDITNDIEIEITGGSS